MAAAGCMEDNSVMDSEEKADNASLDIAEICKKNGASQLLITATISDAKATKPKKGVKINGAVATPCAPSLRSRRDRLGFDTWRKAKKVTAEDCKDEHFYDQLGKTTCAVKGEPLKNNPVSNSDLATCCQHVSSKKTITESCCKLQNGNVCRNGTPSSTCAKLEGAIVKDQIAKTENGLLKKDKAENCEAKSERGTSCAKTTAKIEKLTARSDHANNKTDKGITKSESTNTKSKEHLKSEILNSKLEKSVTKTEEHLSKTDKGIAKLKLTETQLELECLKSENGNVKSENESIKIEDTTFKGEKPCSPNHKKNLNSLMCGPLKLSSGLECKVKTKVPCHNSNGIHFVVRLQSPTITNTSMSVSNLWRTNSSEFNTPDTSRSSTPQPLFGGCALFSPGGTDAGKVLLEKPVEKPVLTQCKWSKCGESLEPATLMDHIRQSHVDSQADQETFVCLWDSCKVYNKASSSKSWLQRHILCHSGDKPFRCIVDGCQLRFPSQNALERHVNSHFNTLPPPSARSIRSRDDTPTKVCRKKRLKRKRPGKVRTGDFFDSGVMDFIHQDMIKIANKTQLDINSGSNNSVTFQSTVIGRRTDESGKAHILLHYTPEDVLPDCWIPESQADKSLVRTIPIADLPRDSAVNLDQSLYRAHRFRKHRRK